MNALFKNALAVGILSGAVGFVGVPRAQAQRYEYQPQMQAALQSLRQAEEALRRADSDKGGHRVRALQMVTDAEREVQAGISYDNSHRDHRGDRDGDRDDRDRDGRYHGGYNSWHGRLSTDDQQRFDSYYSRWLEYRRTNNRDEIVSMEKRMQDVKVHYNIPPNTPYDQIASHP
jgi:hypothetical protein